MTRVHVDVGSVDVDLDIDDYLNHATDKALLAEIERRDLDLPRPFTDAELADLKTFVDLSKTDPESAAVYFHRATGRHLFEVQQPCLL